MNKLSKLKQRDSLAVTHYLLLVVMGFVLSINSIFAYAEETTHQPLMKQTETVAESTEPNGQEIAEDAKSSGSSLLESQVGSQVTKPSEYFAQIIISLVLVLLIIFLAAWLLRRYGRFPGVAEGNLRVLGALSVGQRERILLLQVGKEQVLVGVTTNKISRLHQLEEPVEVTDNDGISSDFSKKLQEALKPKRNASQGTKES